MSTLLRQAMDNYHQPIVSPVSLERLQLQQEIEDVRQEQDLDALSFEHDLACYAQEELTFAIEQIEAVRASIADQTLSQEAQQATTCALESIDPSLGSLDLSMEDGVVDTLKKIWDRIKDMFRRALDAVINFISRIFGGVDRLEKKVSQTRERIQLLQNNNRGLPRDQSGVKGNAPTFQTSHVHHLYLDGDLTIEQLSHGARAVIYNLYPEAHSDINSLHDIYVESLKGFFEIEKESDYDNLTNRVETQLSNLLRSQATEVKKVDVRKANIGFILDNPTLRVYKFGSLPTLPGGYQAVMYTEVGANLKVPLLSPMELHHIGGKTKKGDKSANPIANYLPDVNVSMPRTNEAPILNFEQAESLLQAADKFIEKMRENRPVREELLQKRRELFEKLDEQASDKDGFGKKAIAQLGNRLLKIHLRSVQKDHVKGLLKLDRYVFNYIRHLIGFINESLDALASSTAPQAQ